MEKTMCENKMSPQEYFNIVKERKQHMTDNEPKVIYDNCIELLDKHKITG